MAEMTNEAKLEYCRTLAKALEEDFPGWFDPESVARDFQREAETDLIVGQRMTTEAVNFWNEMGPQIIGRLVSLGSGFDDLRKSTRTSAQFQRSALTSATVLHRVLQRMKDSEGPNPPLGQRLYMMDYLEERSKEYVKQNQRFLALHVLSALTAMVLSLIAVLLWHLGWILFALAVAGVLISTVYSYRSTNRYG